MTNEEYQQKFLEILPNVQKAEFERLQKECQQLEEKYRNFSKNVSEKCADKLVELNKRYIEDSKESYTNFFCKNWMFITFMMNK